MNATVILFSPAWRNSTAAQAAQWAAERGARWTSTTRGNIVLRPLEVHRGALLQQGNDGRKA